MVWNQMGVGYFQHVYNAVQTYGNFRNGGLIALDYLQWCEAPDTACVRVALDIINYCTYSTNTAYRRTIANSIAEVYLKGYWELKANIDTLKNDSKIGVRERMNSRIRSIQRYDNLMHEFDTQEE